MNEKVKFIIVHESIWQSIVSDLCTIGFLVGAVAINKLLIDSTFLNGCIAFIFILGLGGRVANYAKKVKLTPEEAIRYLQEGRYKE